MMEIFAKTISNINLNSPTVLLKISSSMVDWVLQNVPLQVDGTKFFKYKWRYLSGSK